MLRLQAISTESLDPHCLGLLYLWREKIEKKESYCQCTSLEVDNDTNEYYVPRISSKKVK